MIYLSEIFLRHSLDIGSLVFTWLDWAYILTFEFLCAGLNFETSDLVTFCLVGVSFWDLLVLLFLFLHVRFFIKMFSSIPPPLISPKLCSCNCEKLFPNSPPPYSAITNNFKPEPKSTRPEVSEADPQRNKSNTNFWSVQNKSWKYIKYSNIQTSVIYGWKAYTICENNVYLRIAEPQTSATATASLW